MAPLPLEIWREIFTYACTDGGYTGTSLSLTCKLFYNASLLVRFHTLSLFSLRQVELFLAFTRRYEERRHGRQLKVYHLLLSFPSPPPSTFTPGASSDSSSSDCYGSNPAEHWITARRLREQDKAAWDHLFLKLVPGLLNFVGPHLRTLALLQSDGFTLPPLSPFLPRLRELTLLVGISVMVNGHDAFDPSDGSPASPHPEAPGSSSSVLTSPATAAHPETRADATPSSPSARTPTREGTRKRRARLPALERLHVVCGRHRDYTLRDALAHLPALAPRLTHLRISNATYTHERCIPAFLHDALGLGHTHGHGLGAQHPPLRPTDDPVPEPAPGLILATSRYADPDADGREPALPGLRRVLVHSIPPPSVGSSAGPQKEYVALVGAVNAIGAACVAAAAGVDVRVRMLRGERPKQRFLEQLVEAQWVDRIEGGRGCWEGFCGEENGEDSVRV
ncbi:hypothetical protein C8Q77DRAFT_1219803 [Trametes polyzona]|nr:hypothetical protein C8Q77DRAFT_1219803 [Trametes polyzona]